MALVLPFLLAIILGTVEFGYYIYTYSELENATRRASEFASKTPPLTVSTNANDKCANLAKDDAIKGAILSNLNRTDIQVGYVAGNRRQSGDQIQVSTTYNGEFLTPVGQQWFGNTFSFQFTSRRTITSIDPPFGYQADCSP